MTGPRVFDDPSGGDAVSSVPAVEYFLHSGSDCDHGATLTGPIRIVQPVPGDPTRVRETGRSTEDLTYCLVCHQLVPTPGVSDE